MKPIKLALNLRISQAQKNLWYSYKKKECTGRILHVIVLSILYFTKNILIFVFCFRKDVILLSLRFELRLRKSIIMFSFSLC